MKQLIYREFLEKISLWADLSKNVNDFENTHFRNWRIFPNDERVNKRTNLLYLLAVSNYILLLRQGFITFSVLLMRFSAKFRIFLDHND
jgi:hypothetical protein